MTRHPSSALAGTQGGVLEQDRYTLTYRAAEARQVITWLKAGQSGNLIGLRGAGKSNFFRFLLREDVRQHYVGQGYADFVFVLIDLLALTERTEWAVYELILDRLVAKLYGLGLEKGVVEDMVSLYQDVARSRTPHSARRAVERCVDLLCQRPARRVILLLDEFDVVFQELAPSLFRVLRAIRDAHKEQVAYVVITVNDLASLRDDLAEVEHFYRLVSRNACGLGPYNEADARQMAHYLASRRSPGSELSAEDTARLVQLSGGHAGLLKATMSLPWDTGPGRGLAELAPLLHQEPVIQAECRKVWDSLPESEQAALCDLVRGAQADPQTLRRLRLKGLVQTSPPAPAIFSLLFADFVRAQAPPSPTGTFVSRSPRIVQIAGQRIKGLSELQFEALYYLYQRRGEVCTKDELIEHVYQQQYHRAAGGIEDARLQTLISRLRKKVELSRYIATVRGEGYRFVEPDRR